MKKKMIKNFKILCLSMANYLHYKEKEMLTFGQFDQFIEMLKTRHGITVSEAYNGNVVLIYNVTKGEYEQDIHVSYDETGTNHYYIVFCETSFPEDELYNDDQVLPQTKYGIIDLSVTDADRFCRYSKRHIRIGHRVHCEPCCATIFENETYYTTHSSADGGVSLAKTTVSGTIWYSGLTIDECIAKCNDELYGNRCVRGASNFLELP